MNIIKKITQNLKKLVAKEKPKKIVKICWQFLRRKAEKLLFVGNKVFSRIRKSGWFGKLSYFYRRFFYHTRLGRKIYNFGKEIWMIIFPPKGSLPWREVIKISSKNLLAGQSRSMVTIGGVMVGVGAIVILVSFSYGLQEMITKRIIWPEALRIADVSSESSLSVLDQQSLEKIKNLPGVKMVEPAVRLAGKVTFENSKAEVVVVGLTNDYLKLSNIEILKGNIFSKQANAPFTGISSLEKFLASGKGEVAGVSTSQLLIEEGSEVKNSPTVSFRLRDGTYVPVYAEPRLTSRRLGFAQGSILKIYKGTLVWGGVYEDQGGQGRTISPDGQEMGKWLKAEFPLWDQFEGVYAPVNSGEGQVSRTGYVNFRDVWVLTEEEKEVETILEKKVLAESTAAASLEGATLQGTEAAKLAEVVATGSASTETILEVPVLKVAQGAKEALVSQAMLKAWGKKEEEVVGKNLDIEFIITNSLLPDISSRVLSEKTEYKIVGVFGEKLKPVVYVPLGDIQSLGVKRFSSLKVLVDKESRLPEVRTLIQSMGLVTRSLSDTPSQINRLFRVIRFLLGSFGAIALIVALFGMFNTMTVSLLERMREIGIMKSLGTTNLDVQRLFLAEAGLMSLVGGICGVIFGGLIGEVINIFVFNFANKNVNQLFLLPLPFAVFIILLTLFIGLATGFYPSRRAKSISALNAIRYE